MFRVRGGTETEILPEADAQWRGRRPAGHAPALVFTGRSLERAHSCTAGTFQNPENTRAGGSPPGGAPPLFPACPAPGELPQVSCASQKQLCGPPGPPQAAAVCSFGCSERPLYCV